MAHDFNIIDKEPHFKIDATTRQITNELASEIAVVQFDHNSEVFTFELPRYIENHDMTECNKVEIHYRNTDPTSLAEVLDVYEVNDLQVDPTDENKAVCTWLISQNATQKVGKLEFLVRFSRVADDGTILYAWNTLMFTGIMISPGLYNSKQVSELYADVLEQWKTQLFSASAEGVENIYTARDSAIYDITDRKFNSLSHLETMRTKAISDIETKGAETLASIPNDYKTLYKKVGEHQTAIDTLNKGGLVLKDDVIGQHVEEWLGEHPEATTTVENDSVTVKKLFKKDLPFLTPEMFGAVGDGVTDDTKAIRDMVTYGKTYGVTSFIFGSAKTYIVSLPEIVMSNDWSTNTQRSQAVKNIINVNFANAKFDLNKSTIKLTGNMYPFYSIFYVNGDNCTIENGIIEGEKNEHDYTTYLYRQKVSDQTHEFGFGIEQVACKNLVVDNMEIFNTTGDAIITGDATSTCTATIKNCNLHHCRRQGISCLGGDKIYVYDTDIHHIGTTNGIDGTSPMSGIDLEPDSGTKRLNYFYMNNVKFEQCSSCAFRIGGKDAEVTAIDVHNCYFEGVVNITKEVNFTNCKFVFDKNSFIIVTTYSLNGTYTNCEFDISDHSKLKEGYVSLLGIYDGCTFKGTIDENGKSIALLVVDTADIKNCIFDNIQGNSTYAGVRTHPNANFTKQPFDKIELHNSRLIIQKWLSDFVLEKCLFENSDVTFGATAELKLLDCNFINATTWSEASSKIVMDKCFYSNVTAQDVFSKAHKIIRNCFIDVLKFSTTAFPSTIKSLIANTTIKVHEGFNLYYMGTYANCYNLILDTNYHTQEDVAKYPNLVNTFVVSTEAVS